MLHAVRTEEDVDKLVMRLIILNAPKARVGKTTFIILSVTFALQAFVWVVIMMCYHANMADVPEAGCKKELLLVMLMVPERHSPVWNSSAAILI